MHHPEERVAASCLYYRRALEMRLAEGCRDRRPWYRICAERENETPIHDDRARNSIQGHAVRCIELDEILAAGVGRQSRECEEEERRPAQDVLCSRLAEKAEGDYRQMGLRDSGQVLKRADKVSLVSRDFTEIAAVTLSTGQRDLLFSRNAIDMS